MLTLLATGLVAFQSDWVLHDLARVATVRMPAIFPRDSAHPYRMSFVGSSIFRTLVTEQVGRSADYNLHLYMRAAREGLRRGTVTSETDAWVGGRPALEFTIRTPEGGQLRSKAICVDTTVVAIEMITFPRQPAPTEAEVSTFFGSFQPKEPVPTPDTEPGPQWVSVQEEGFTSLHTRNRVTTTLPEGAESSDQAKVTYSIYADRAYITGSWALQAEVNTLKDLAPLARGFVFWAQTGGFSFDGYPPRLSLKGSIRGFHVVGKRPKVVIEGDTHDGISFRIVANPIGKRVIFRSFAGPTPMLNSTHVTRWFNGFRLDPR